MTHLANMSTKSTFSYKKRVEITMFNPTTCMLWTINIFYNFLKFYESYVGPVALNIFYDFFIICETIEKSFSLYIHFILLKWPKISSLNNYWLQNTPYNPD